MNNTDLDDIDLSQQFKPRMIDRTIGLEVWKALPEPVRQHMKALGAQGWKFYAVSQQRGRCCYRSKTITIPSWAFKQGLDYYTWYVCHEMAHAHAGWNAKHGPEFMKELIRICPTDCIKLELHYKPRNASSAGIGKLSDKDLLDLL